MEAPRTRVERRPADRLDRSAAVVRRAIELARAAARGLAVLALVAAGSAALAWLAWIEHDPPAGANDWAARVVVLAIALVPSAVLAVFLAGVRQLAELPRRMRDLPPDLRAQVGHVRWQAARPRRRVGAVGSTVRLVRLLFDARDVLSPFAVVTSVLRPALVFAALGAALVAIVEIPLALLVALVLAAA